MILSRTMRTIRNRFPFTARTFNRQPIIKYAYKRSFASHATSTSTSTSPSKDNDKSYAKYLMEEGAKLLELGSLDMAMDAYTQASRIYPTSTAYYNIGNIYFQLGNIQDARDNWNKSVDMDSSFADVHVNLGNLELSYSKDPKKAADHYLKALELDPSDGEIRFNLAVAYDNMQRYEDSIGEYQSALEYLKSKESEDDSGDVRSKIEHLEAILKNAQVKLWSQRLNK